jgi:hypothetical protein
MARITRARMLKEADYLENVAAKRSEAAAISGEQVANDPSYSDQTRTRARIAAHYARENAAEYREWAAELRDGEIPAGFEF